VTAALWAGERLRALGPVFAVHEHDDVVAASAGDPAPVRFGDLGCSRSGPKRRCDRVDLLLVNDAAGVGLVQAADRLLRDF
jgi:hypothetical protein